jgi:transcriptional regulator with XRE-family HTH domain
MARVKARDVIAHNLKTLREIRRMSQIDLAEAVGVSRRTIARLEAGDIEDPGVDQMLRIARALRVTISTLVDAPLEPVTLAVPAALRDALEGTDGPAILERMLRAARSQAPM